MYLARGELQLHVRERLKGEVMAMCGAVLWGSAWGFWWIFPLIGLLMCLVMVFRFACRGGGGCMGGHGATPNDKVRESRG